MHKAGQSLGKIDNTLMQVTAMHVQCGLLPPHRFGDHRVGMANAGYVVVHINVLTTITVIEVGTFAPDNMKRLIVKESGACAEEAITALNE
jgi:alkyl hydroperoxide reductase subunit AhpF